MSLSERAVSGVVASKALNSLCYSILRFGFWCQYHPTNASLFDLDDFRRGETEWRNPGSLSFRFELGDTIA